MGARGCKSVLPVMAGLATGLCAVVARAQPAADVPEDEPLAKARAALDSCRAAPAKPACDEAVRLAEPRRATGAPGSRVEALEVIGTGHVLAGRIDEGRRAFGELLDLAPAFELSDPALPAPVRTAFDEEAAARRDKSRRIDFVPDANEATLFIVRVADDGPAVSRVLVSCREAGRVAFAPIAASDSSGGKPRSIHLRSARPHSCFAVAYDRDDLPVGRAGTRARPVELTPRADRPASAPPLATAAADQPIVNRWWFWAVVGLAAAGALTVAIAAASSGPDPPAENVGTAQGKLSVSF